MKRIVSVSLDEETIAKIREILQNSSYRNKSHVVEEAIKNLFNMSEIIHPNLIRVLETPSTTRSGIISEHVKNHLRKGDASKICHPPQRVVFNENEH